MGLKFIVFEQKATHELKIELTKITTSEIIPEHFLHTGKLLI